jgi:hypothetical protein
MTTVRVQDTVVEVVEVVEEVVVVVVVRCRVSWLL